jgi:hypothetical protein
MTRYGFGREQAINRAQESREGKKKESGIDKEAVDLAVKAVENMPTMMDRVVNYMVGATNPLAKLAGDVQLETRYLAGQGAQKALSTDGSFKKKEIPAEDFTIRTLPEDTLVGAGGTKLGKGVENKLDTLISVMQSGGNIYLDGNKVGNTLAQNPRRL